MNICKFLETLLIISIYLSISQPNIINANIIHDIACKFYECCDKPYLLHNLTLLQEYFDKYIFGQPLVKDTTVNAIKAHLNIPNPSKALVLSFHGNTGSGKNYVADLVAKSLFRNGRSSRFYRYFSSQRDFPHDEKLGDYKEYIIRTIESVVSKCEHSLFVFDEMDKIPIGLIDVIKAYIDFNQNINGKDYRKTIFIFLSNSASKEINQKTFELESKNIMRDNFELKMFQNVIHEHNFNHKSDNNKGMWHSVLISNHLIDHYIPFLPLRREHVKHCIEIEFKKINISPNSMKTFHSDVDYIADELTYEPTGYNWYSTSGCKRISQLIRKFSVERKLDELKNEL